MNFSDNKKQFINAVQAGSLCQVKCYFIVTKSNHLLFSSISFIKTLTLVLQTVEEEEIHSINYINKNIE